MRFKEWLLLNELRHVSFDAPMRVNNILCDGIDFRAEDWKRGFNPAKHGGRMVPVGMPNPAPYIMADNFSAPVSGGYLNVATPRPGKTVTWGNVALQPMVGLPEVEISAEPFELEMPKQWFDFAVFYLGNKVVKPPEWPRDRFEQGSIGEIES